MRECCEKMDRDVGGLKHSALNLDLRFCPFCGMPLYLTQEQEETLTWLTDVGGVSPGVVFIPSRKSPTSSPEIRERCRLLKELVYLDLINVDFSVANPNDETSETCLVFYTRNKLAVRADSTTAKEVFEASEVGAAQQIEVTVHDEVKDSESLA